MKNLGKQMLRTPLQSLFIIVLIMIVTVILVVGGNLWITSGRLSKAYEEDFITIGTVVQKPDTVQERRVWDAEKGDYLLYKDSIYNRYAAEKDMDFPETRYLTEPEKRVYWGSYGPEYVHVGEDRAYSYITVAEFSPQEDYVPEESGKILIKRILGSDKRMEGSVVWFCDHTNRYPEELKADRTYVAMITETGWTHGKEWDAGDKIYDDLEFAPEIMAPTLYTPEGKRIEDPLDMQGIYELTEGFYETEAGQRFLAAADTAALYYETQPVVGTNSTDLLMPFYEQSAWVCEGRYPTQEEYEKGSPVCLVPRTFAENNGLSVGDAVSTRLYFTNAATRPDIAFNVGGGRIDFQFMGLDGKLLTPFEEKEYTIVGIYDHTQLTEGIGRDELIVPLNSVQNKMENIVDYGPMADDNTSFQIPNGSISDFLETSAKYGVDNLVFTFYDRGYSALKEGIENLKNMSAALLVMGVIAAVILTMQISHIYITKQRKRLAIERLMGMTGKQCRNISLAGILLLLMLGITPGVAAGIAVAEQVDVEDMGQEDFDRKYSNLGIAAETSVDLSGQGEGDVRVSCIMGVLVAFLGMGLSGARVRRLLKGEPLYLVEDGMSGK